MKEKICIASFLKPVNDIRGYEKLAQSLAHSGKYQLYCAGYPSKIKVSDKKITFLPLRKFNRTGFSRWIARWQMFTFYVKVKPKLIIVNSPDLLFVTSLYKIIFGSKIIYDIRENYAFNLLYQSNYPVVVKHLLAGWVRTKEWLTAPLFTCFFLAEKIYEQQLTFVGKRFTILENKALKSEKICMRFQSMATTKFIISGTIAQEYGVLQGVDFFVKFKSRYPQAELCIIGHCASAQLAHKLNTLAQNHSGIVLHVSPHPIPHARLEAALLQASVGLLPYLPNKSTKGKVPTKLFEYAAYGLPCLVQDQPDWAYFVRKHQSGLPFNFVRFNTEDCIEVVKRLKQLPPALLLPDLFWQTEEPKLLRCISQALS